METKRTQLDDQLSQLRQEFAGKVESLQTLQGEHTQLLSEAEALKEQSASTQMRASQVEAALAESQASLNKLKSDHAAREAKYTLLLESLEKLNAQKSQEISRLRAQFASMKSENDNTVEAMAELRKYVRAAREAIVVPISSNCFIRWRKWKRLSSRRNRTRKTLPWTQQQRKRN